MSLILTALGTNKWLQYIILAGIILSGVSILYLKIRNGGRDTEKLRQAEESLRRAHANAAIRIDTERMSTASARRMLKDKYGLGRN